MKFLGYLLPMVRAAGVGDWIGVASGALKLVNAIVARVKEEQIREDEARKIFTTEIAQLTKRLDLQDEINDAIEKMSDADLDDELARDSDS